MLNQYRFLLEELPSCVAEKPYNSVYECLTERHLQAMWLEQKYFKQLFTTTGEPIQVVSPGIWNAEAGPDFLKAHLKIGEQEYFGDIELHLRAESWQHHGHHLDKRYDNVILHIAFWKSHSEISIETHTRKKIPQTAFEGAITIVPQRIVQLLDLDLYPYKKFIGSGKCAQSLFKSLPEEEIVSFFKNAATWRLQQKRNYLHNHVKQDDLLMSAGIAMALGYKNNTEAFLELFLSLHPVSHIGEEALFASALNSCGFFEDHFRNKWGLSDRYNHSLKISQEQSVVLPKIKLALNQIRPLNHPVRRLAALVKLVRDPDLKHIFSKMLDCWRKQYGDYKNKKWFRQVYQELLDLLPTYSDAYWNKYYLFESQPQEESLPLIGVSLKSEILTNTFLPLLKASISKRSDPHEMEAFDIFYASMPASENSKTQYLIHRFFGDTPKGTVLKRADTEQGAYQLHRDFCLHYEASCSGCPFVERYKAHNTCPCP